MARVYNFSAGPSMLPEYVLRKAQAGLLDYQGSGQSVMEMSHRSPWFEDILHNTEAAMRRVLGVPDNYKIGFFQGGATQQFAMVPLNLMTTGTADYIVTGNFSKKAAEEAAKFGHRAHRRFQQGQKLYLYSRCQGHRVRPERQLHPHLPEQHDLRHKSLPNCRRWRASRWWRT